MAARYVRLATCSASVSGFFTQVAGVVSVQTPGRYLSQGGERGQVSLGQVGLHGGRVGLQRMAQQRGAELQRGLLAQLARHGCVAAVARAGRRRARAQLERSRHEARRRCRQPPRVRPVQCHHAYAEPVARVHPRVDRRRRRAQQVPVQPDTR